MEKKRRGESWVNEDGISTITSYPSNVVDEPKTATAAQMASRNLRNAKNKRRAAPVASSGVPQSMTFGAGDATGASGGLFGGSFGAGNATGFDFSTSGPQAPTFPSASFGFAPPLSQNQDAQMGDPGQQAFGGFANNSNHIFAAGSPSNPFAQSSTTAMQANGTFQAPSHNPFGQSSTTASQANGTSLFSPAAQPPSSNGDLFSRTSGFPKTSTSQNIAPTQPNMFGSVFSGAGSSAPAPPNMFGTPSPAAQPTAPKSDLFSRVTRVPASAAEVASPAPPNMFGSVFSGGGSSTPTPPNIFGTASPAAQQTAPKSDLFSRTTGFPKASTSASNDSVPSNIFGSVSGSSAPAASSLFNSTSPLKPVDAPPIISQPPPSNIFSKSNTPASTSQLFSTKPVDAPPITSQATPSSMFSNMNTPANTTQLFPTKPIDAPPSTSQSPSKGIFSNTNIPASTSQLFSAKSFDTPSSASQSPSKGIFANMNTAPTNGTPLFSPMKTVDAPSIASQPAPSGMFPSLPRSTPALPSNVSSKPEVASMTAGEPLSFSKALVNGNTTSEVDYELIYSERNQTDEELAHMVPTYSETRKTKFYELFRRRALNVLAEETLTAHPYANYTKFHAFYAQKVEEISTGSKRKFLDDEAENQDSSKRARHIPPMSNIFQPHSAPKRKSSDDRDADEENANPAKRSRPELTSTSSVLQPIQPRTQSAQSPKKSGSQYQQPQTSLNGVTDAAFQRLEDMEQEIFDLKREVATTRDPRDRQILERRINKLQADLDRRIENLPKAPPRNQSANPPSTSAPTTASTATQSTSGKRKADVQLTKDDYEKESQQTKARGINGDANGSSTSNIFKGLVESPANGSSTKKFAPLPGSPSFKKDVSPLANPFGALSVPKSPTKTSAPPTSMFAASSSSNVGSSNMFAQKPAPNMSAFAPSSTADASAISASKPSTNMFAPQPVSNGTTANPFATKFAPAKANVDAITPEAGPPKAGPPKFATGSVNFMAQFAAKAKDTEKAVMDKAMEEDFDSSEGEEAREQWKADYLAKRKAKHEDYERASKRSKFVPSIGNVASVVQSATKAQDNAMSAEEEEIEKQMWKELKSWADKETQDEWKRFYLVRQKAAKQKAARDENERTGKGTGLIPGSKGKEIGSATKSRSVLAAPARDESQSASPSNMFFAQATQSPGNSGLDSGTSTPGPNRSGTGSVLDGSGPDRSGDENIFSHLTSKAQEEDTASESEQEEYEQEEDDQEEYDEEEYDQEEDEEEDDGKPKFKSLFDRISKDANGNWIRGDISEDDENTEPTPKAQSLFAGVANWKPQAASSETQPFVPPTLSTKNHFASMDGPKAPPASPATANTQPRSIFDTSFLGLNKAPAVAADNTWKPNTPIKFGGSSSTPEDNGIPQVSITEVTPFKTSTPGLFSSLNSNPKPAFANLFGSLSPKPSASSDAPRSTGFTFGTPSTAAPKTSPPITSAGAGFAAFSSGSKFSPFLTAGLSGGTSRATSPGNTTDGASDYEDPEAEQHDQIDLTSGGPGEEDEEELHKVRAKALQFIPGEDGAAGTWSSKGVGPLRVLKHKETGAVRIVLRQDPSGKVIINKALLPKAEFKQNDKTVRFPAAADGGGLETWLLQVKEKEWAEKLAEILEASK